MTVVVGVIEPRRKLPEMFKQQLHKRLDELIDMYERGDPLWIVGGDSLWSSEGSVKVRTDFREYV